LPGRRARTRRWRGPWPWCGLAQVSASASW
jgi:hypothetical protein